MMLDSLFHTDFERLPGTIEFEASYGLSRGEDTRRWRWGMGGCDDQGGIPVDRIHAVSLEFPVEAVLLDYANGVNLDEN
jgi:hypothetical protein